MKQFTILAVILSVSVVCDINTSVAQSTRCGDERVDAGEQCDDGNPVGGDGCSATCFLEQCGSGQLDPGEQCDDGNTVGGDGCSATCRSPIVQAATTSRALPGAAEFPNNPQAAYVLIGSPITPLDPDPRALLRQAFGAPGIASWRLFRLDAAQQALRELIPGDPAFNFTQGRGFWLITSKGGTLEITGTPNDSTLPANITLLPGFTQIADPFNFPIDWNCVLRGLPKEQRNLSLLGFTQGYVIVNRLEPLFGYLVGNPNESTIVVSISADCADLEPRTLVTGREERGTTIRTPTTPSEGGGWRVKLSVISGAVADTDNHIGEDIAGQDDYDALDFQEPPMMLGLSLSFLHRDWDTENSRYTTDIRSFHRTHPQVWEVEVRSSKENTTIQLHWKLEGVDEEQLTLIDVKGKQMVNMRNVDSYTYQRGKRGVRHFQVRKE